MTMMMMMMHVMNGMKDININRNIIKDYKLYYQKKKIKKIFIYLNNAKYK
jgi:hypothetical protein